MGNFAADPLNREIGQKAGGITFSAVAKSYARIVRKLEQDAVAMKTCKRDEARIVSRVTPDP